ncbi:MAG: hypothetical protein ABJA82_06015 [Myxococcales bacterium]
MTQLDPAARAEVEPRRRAAIRPAEPEGEPVRREAAARVLGAAGPKQVVAAPRPEAELDREMVEQPVP